MQRHCCESFAINQVQWRCVGQGCAVLGYTWGPTGTQDGPDGNNFKILRIGKHDPPLYVHENRGVSVGEKQSHMCYRITTDSRTVNRNGDNCYVRDCLGRVSGRGELKIEIVVCHSSAFRDIGGKSSEGR